MTTPYAYQITAYGVVKSVPNRMQHPGTSPTFTHGMAGVRQLGAILHNVPTNNATTDFQFALGTVTNWNGTTTAALVEQFQIVRGCAYTPYYEVVKIQCNNPGTGSSAAATAGIYTASGAGGTGIAVVGSNTLATLNAASATLYQNMTIAAQTNLFNADSLFFRIGTASGVASTTIDVYVWIEACP